MAGGRVGFLQSPIYEIKMRYIASLAIEIRGVIFIFGIESGKKGTLSDFFSYLANYLFYPLK